MIEQKTIEHSQTPQHPLWLSVVLSLFPSVVLGAFIVGLSSALKGGGWIRSSLSSAGSCSEYT